jgi:hypothetical protein
MREHVGEFSLRAMCRAFGVARSGYYQWKRQGCTTQQARSDSTLTGQIRAVFEKSGQTYGSPRVHAELSHRDARGKSTWRAMQSPSRGAASFVVRLPQSRTVRTTVSVLTAGTLKWCKVTTISAVMVTATLSHRYHHPCGTGMPVAWDRQGATAGRGKISASTMLSRNAIFHAIVTGYMEIVLILEYRRC